MADDASKQTLYDAVTALRSAEQLLLDASRSMTDPAQLIQLNLEYTHLDSYLSQILHTLAITDEDDFTRSSAALKTQSATLATDIQQIQKVIKNAATADKVIGLITQATASIAKL
jgi:hypothetical protein